MTIETEADAELEAGTVVETIETVEASDEDKLLIERARRMGWRPKDEYSGAPSRWVDFREFVERGDNELPILRERFRKLDERLAGTDAKLAEADKRVKESAEVLIELRDMSRIAEQRGYERATHELRQRELRAVAEADTAEFERIARERDALIQSRPPVAPAAPARTEAPPAPTNMPPINPVIETWVQANPWFRTDPVLNAYAMDVDRDVERSHYDWPMEDKLAEVKRRVVMKFPEKFDNPRRTAPAAVSTSSAPAPKTKGKTVKDLPPEAKAALDRFKRTIPGYNEAEYLKLYFKGEE